MTTKLTAQLGSQLADRRAARAARRRLEQELASYQTPAELSELEAILGRYDDHEVTDIRQILTRRRAS